MSREQKVAVVEAYSDCYRTKDLSKASFAEDVTFEGPRMPKLAGRATILGFLTQILPVVRGIQVKQHIVEGKLRCNPFRHGDREWSGSRF